MEKLKNKIDEILNQYEGWDERGFGVHLNGGPQLHMEVVDSKFKKEYSLPQKNKWETEYDYVDGDWVVDIHRLDKNELFEVIDLFGENVVNLFHSHIIIDELIDDYVIEYDWKYV